MTHKLDYRLPLVFLGGLLFQFLFWDELLGLNLLLYTIFIMAITFTDKDIPFHKNKLYTALPHLAIAIYIVYYNSILAIATWFVTLLIYLGTAHFAMLKSTATALIWGALQSISGPYGIVTKLQTTKLGKINFKPVVKPLKYIVVPLLMVVIFCSLYSIANPIFAKYTNAVMSNINYFFTSIFNFLFIDISIPKCLFIILGILITAGIIVGIKSKLLGEVELGANNQLTRKRRGRNDIWLFQDFRTLFAGNQTKKKLALNTENIVGIISLTALNILLLFLNGIDIFTLWFNNNTSKNFSAELHDGTNTLIFSIVIAMLIIIYFFSGNLNFYRKNKLIKLLAYIWIVQNVFLACSVFHRDYDYVLYYGLTYKRIGVAVFATLSLIGLVTVYIKVAKQKTVFFLYRVNSKIWYVLLILLSFINWDILIVNYNLNHADKIGIDVDHLMSFSDKTLPLLEKNRNKLKKHIIETTKRKIETDSTFVPPPIKITIDTAAKSTPDNVIESKIPNNAELKTLAIQQAKDEFNKRIDNRISWFIKKQKSVSWLSFSYLEWESIQVLRPAPTASINKPD